MKKAWLVILLVVRSMGAEFYQAYDYNDTHMVKTTTQAGIRVQKVLVRSRLHVHQIEENGTVYDIVWLQPPGVNRKNEIDSDSLNAPFVVKNADRKGGFVIASVEGITEDGELLDRLVGIVDTLQFQAQKNGVFRWKNAMGSVEANQTAANGGMGRHVTYLGQFTGKKPRRDITYLESNISIGTDANATWARVDVKERIRFDVRAMKTVMTDARMLTLRKRKRGLPKSHWFLQLGHDVAHWGFGDTNASTMSNEEAAKLFALKQKQMKALLDDRKKFAQWVLDNMDFLMHLDTLLEERKLDDDVSKTLFAFLGYVDTPESSTILSRVLLNENIAHKERFRSLMGLKNTSAKIDDETLERLVDRGLYGRGDTMLERASGMLLGAMAQHRMRRAPGQYEKIEEAIVNAIETSNDKVVALNAAKNMHEAASDRIVQSVENVLRNGDDPVGRKVSAEALAKIGRSDLDTEDFRQLFLHEGNTDVKAQILRSSTVAENFKEDAAYREFLVSVAQGPDNASADRLAALEALETAGYGKTKEQKSIVRRMMVGEKDRSVMRTLLRLYRR